MSDDGNADNWAVMLVPFSFIETDDRLTAKLYLQRAVGMSGDITTAERTTFYRSLLTISWLPPALRRVVMAELGVSVRRQKRDFEEGATLALRHLIEERKQAMRAQRLRPRGGIHEAAVAEIAHRQGMGVAALKKRLQRYKRRQKN